MPLTRKLNISNCENVCTCIQFCDINTQKRSGRGGHTAVRPWCSSLCGGDMVEYSSDQSTAQGQCWNERFFTSDCFVRDAQNLTFALRYLTCEVSNIMMMATCVLHGLTDKLQHYSFASGNNEIKKWDGRRRIVCGLVFYLPWTPLLL